MWCALVINCLFHDSCFFECHMTPSRLSQEDSWAQDTAKTPAWSCHLLRPSVSHSFIQSVAQEFHCAVGWANTSGCPSCPPRLLFSSIHPVYRVLCMFATTTTPLWFSAHALLRHRRQPHSVVRCFSDSFLLLWEAKEIVFFEGRGGKGPPHVRLFWLSFGFIFVKRTVVVPVVHSSFSLVRLFFLFEIIENGMSVADTNHMWKLVFFICFLNNRSTRRWNTQISYNRLNSDWCLLDNTPFRAIANRW